MNHQVTNNLTGSKTCHRLSSDSCSVAPMIEGLHPLGMLKLRDRADAEDGIEDAIFTIDPLTLLAGDIRKH